MEEITFHCRFITPAFLGGANPRGTPELRAPSIKGALRFWWRAQCGITDLQEMKEKETEIFGGIEGDSAVKSSFTIRVSHEEFITGQELPRSMTPVRNKHFKVNIFEYLAFGIYEQKEKKLNRDFVKQGQRFQTKFTFSKIEFKKEILMSFRLLALFGGIGTKSRNGFGKFEIINDSESLSWKLALQKLKIGKQKSFTAFSEKMLCFHTDKTFEKADQALADVGKAYKYAREYVEEQHSFEERSYIASPIMEYDKHAKKSFQVSFLDRHSKSYFISVVPQDGEYLGIIFFLPYLFLEGADEVLKELYNSKKQNSNDYWNQKKILIDTSIPKHQEYYKETNDNFHKKLCHQYNPNALKQVKI